MRAVGCGLCGLSGMNILCLWLTDEINVHYYEGVAIDRVTTCLLHRQTCKIFTQLVSTFKKSVDALYLIH